MEDSYYQSQFYGAQIDDAIAMMLNGIRHVTAGIFGLHINPAGHLIYTYSDQEKPYDFKISGDGHLQLTFT